MDQQQKRNARWIWYFGDFEHYHHMLLSMRRENRGVTVPTFWYTGDCHRSVRFRKDVSLAKEETITVILDGDGCLSVDGARQKTLTATLAAGEHRIVINVCHPNGIPAAYVSGDTVLSDESWTADCELTFYGGDFRPVGCGELCDPMVKPSEYELPLVPATATDLSGEGTLYDFGEEKYLRLLLTGLAAGQELTVFYGESLAEAKSSEHCVLIDRVVGTGEEMLLPLRACRYVRLSTPCHVSGREFKPDIAFRGVLSSDRALLNKIYAVCLRTYELTSPIFFLDGIKRDGWVWGGDSYQSCLFDYYSCFDPAIIRRTIIALRGSGAPRYVNGIVDYTYFWFIMLGDYYRYTGDGTFLVNFYDSIRSLADYCIAETDSDGMVETVPHIWSFVDWADMTKDGKMCILQMLLCRGMENAALCAEAAGQTEDAARYAAFAHALEAKIDDCFWNEELGGYVTALVDDKQLPEIRRHQNLMAILLGFADERKTEAIVKNVIDNEAIPPIVTPYFKLYELETRCRLGRFDEVLAEMESYWGGMLKEGATSFWECYDPTEKGEEHYAMYGNPYDRSLCHAWGASPLYLIGRYFAGVCPTSPGYTSFRVEPQLSAFGSVKLTVPVCEGSVTLQKEGNILTVTAIRDGGTLVCQGREVPLIADCPCTLTLTEE